jgi:hypothetical protein
MACLLFVEFDAATKRFNVTPESREFLLSLGDTQLAVVALAGPYRAGKSTLLNRVLLELPPGATGFEVGHTVNACTRGLWLSTKLLPCAAPNSATLVIDTEGLGATTADRTHDTNIFALALLLSSLFMYNSKNAIDQASLNDLSLVTQISKHMRMNAPAPQQQNKRRKAEAGSSDGDQQQQNEEELREALPTFMYIIRDFVLKLQDTSGKPISASTYLDNALQHVDGADADKNEVRRTLRTMFAKRDCFTMVQPSSNPIVLQNLHKHPDADLDRMFVEQAARLREKVQQYAHPKKLDARTPVTGALLVMLAEQYCQAFNEKRTPVIRDVWKYITVEQCQTALKAAVAHFETQMASDDSIDTRRKLETHIKAAFDAAAKLFHQQAVGDSSEAFESLRSAINAKAAELRKTFMERLAEKAAMLLNNIDVETLAPEQVVKQLQHAQVEFAKCGKDPESQSAWDRECCARLMMWLPTIIGKQTQAAQEAQRHARELQSQSALQEDQVRSLSDLLAASTNKCADLEQQITSLGNQQQAYLRLTDELLPLRQRVAELEPLAALAQDAQSGAEDLTKQRDELLRKTVAADEVAITLRAELAEAQAKIQPLEQALKQLQQTQADQLAEMHEQTRAALNQLRDSKDAALKKTSQLQQETDALKKQLAQAQQDLAHQRSLGAEKLQEQLASQTQSHRLEMQKKETEKAELVNRFNQDLARIRAENNEARTAQAEEHRQALAQLSSDKSQIEARYHAQTIDLTGVKQSLEQKTAETQQLRLDLKAARCSGL